MIRTILKSPFKTRGQKQRHFEEVLDPSLETGTWGSRTSITQEVKTEETGAVSWRLAKDKTVINKKNVRTEQDYYVIRKYGLIATNYFAVKPYVLAKMTNAEIGKMLGKSTSWANQLVPKVKESLKMEG